MKKQVDVINDKSTFLGLYGKKKIFINKISDKNEIEE